MTGGHAESRQTDPLLPWWPVARPGGGALNLASIAAAALELLDQGGESHLTMRRLADRLGSSTMAIYWHIATRAELLAVVRDTAMEPVREAVEHSQGWREVLEALGRSIHVEIALRHPHVVPLVFSSDHVPGPNLLATLERAFAALFDAGFEVSDAAAVLQMVSNTAIAFRDDIDTSDLQRVAFGDIGAYPALARLMTDDQQTAATTRFEIALSAALAGIESTIEPASIQG